MSLAVTSLPTWLVAVLFVVVMPAAVVAVQVGIRRTRPALAEGRHNEVAGFLIAVVGVIYAVLLAFVVIVSREKLLLFVVTVIDFPFQGSVRVEPHAMERVLSDLSR